MGIANSSLNWQIPRGNCEFKLGFANSILNCGQYGNPDFLGHRTFLTLECREIQGRDTEERPLAGDQRDCFLPVGTTRE